MTLPLATITGDLSLPFDGVPLRATAIFELSDWDISGGEVIYPGAPATFDLIGVAVATLPPECRLFKNALGERGTRWRLSVRATYALPGTTREVVNVAVLGEFQVKAEDVQDIGVLLAEDLPEATAIYLVTDIIAEEFAGTAYTVVSADKGKAKESTSASPVAVTLPNNAPAGFWGILCQGGTGAMTVQAQAGAAIRQEYGLAVLNRQWSEVGYRVRKNVDGSSAEYVMSGALR